MKRPGHASWCALDAGHRGDCVPPTRGLPAPTPEATARCTNRWHYDGVDERTGAYYPYPREFADDEPCPDCGAALPATPEAPTPPPSSQPAGVPCQSCDQAYFDGRAGALEEAAREVADLGAYFDGRNTGRRAIETALDRIRSLIPTTTPPGDAHGRDREGAVSRVQAGVPVAAEVVPALRDAEPVAEVVSTTTPAADGREGGAAPAAKPEHAASPVGGLPGALPCPWCGPGTNLSMLRHETGHFKVMCLNCGCQGPFDTTTHATALKEWNRRAASPAAAPGVSGEGRACETCGGGEPTSSYKHYPGCEAAEEERMAAAERRGAESERRRHAADGVLALLREARAERDAECKRAEALTDRVEALERALEGVVALHDYRFLDKGIGTSTAEGRAWVRARAALPHPDRGEPK